LVTADASRTALDAAANAQARDAVESAGALVRAPLEAVSRALSRRAAREGDVGIVGTHPAHARWLNALASRRRRWTARLLAEAASRATQPAPLQALGVPPPRRITAIRVLAADTHNGGRAPVAIELDGRSTVVYKPVSLAGERLFALAAQLVADSSGDPALCEPTPSVAGASRWGLVAYCMPVATPLDADGRRRFFTCAGAITAIAYAICATDLHLENLVAAGVRPVLIDLETVPYRFPRELADDVTLTGLLDPMDGGRSLSGLQGGGEIRHLGVFPSTDGGRVRYWRASTHDANRARDTSGDLVDAQDHVAALRDGFAAAYDALAVERDRIRAMAVTLAGQDRFQGRHLLRPTIYYTLLQLQLLQPGPRPLAHRVAELRARLEADWPEHERRDPSVIDCEMHDLLRGDVPYFRAGAGERALAHHSGAVMTGFFEETALERLEERLDRLGPEDRDRQVAVIERSLERLPRSDRAVR
jgi:lantibiotic modifying enzyme